MKKSNELIEIIKRLKKTRKDLDETIQLTLAELTPDEAADLDLDDDSNPGGTPPPPPGPQHP